MRLSFIILLSLCHLIPVPAWAQMRTLLPLREWTSPEGSTLTAELIGFEGDNALLRHPDGRRVTVPESRFSAIDRAELLRSRLLNFHWDNFSEPLSTHFFQSYHVPQARASREVATYVAFGPNRFNLGIMILSSKVDLREFDQVICQDAAGRTEIYNYRSEDVATLGNAPKPITRVSLGIQPGRNAGFLPILKNQLAQKQAVVFQVLATASGKRDTIVLSPNEAAALAEMVSVYEKAADLVQEGAVQRAPLKQQVFGAPAATPAAPPATPSTMAAAGIDDAALEPFRNQRTVSKLGEMIWTAKGGEGEKVEALGWIQTSVVIRKSDRSVHAVPIQEIDAASRERILSERIKRHAGQTFVETDLWRYHYPKDWDQKKQAFHQAITFVRHKAKGDPYLFVRFYSSSFKGEPIDQIYFQSEEAGGFLRIPVESRLTRKQAATNGAYSIVSVRLERSQAAQVLHLINRSNIVVRIASGKNNIEITLKEDDAAASQEAIALYIWSS